MNIVGEILLFIEFSYEYINNSIEYNNDGFHKERKAILQIWIFKGFY